MATSHKNQLTPDEIARFKEVFMQFDSDGDGTIATKDLGPALRLFAINLTDTELGTLLDEADIERKGPVDFPDFINLVVMKSPHLFSQAPEDLPSEK